MNKMMPPPPSQDANGKRGDTLQRFRVSVGVCAYNEEANIANFLRSLQKQQLVRVAIDQIVVVSSGSTDRTNEIVESFCSTDSRIELVKEIERRGKAAAVNLFLASATGDICVLAGADTVLHTDSVEHLCRDFSDGGVGMTGGRVIPVNDAGTFMGFTVHLVWSLAHQLSISAPKLGEYVAFRRVMDAISPVTAVDEAAIEAEIRRQGYVLRYVPVAIVYNRGPASVSDFIKQRRRIHAGHLYLRRTEGYTVSSMSNLRLLRIVMSAPKPNPRTIAWTAGAVTLEALSRVLGTYDVLFRGRSHQVWKVSHTTKGAIQSA